MLWLLVTTAPPARDQHSASAGRQVLSEWANECGWVAESWFPRGPWESQRRQKHPEFGEPEGFLSSLNTPGWKPGRPGKGTPAAREAAASARRLAWPAPNPAPHSLVSTAHMRGTASPSTAGQQARCSRSCRQDLLPGCPHVRCSRSLGTPGPARPPSPPASRLPPSSDPVPALPQSLGGQHGPSLTGFTDLFSLTLSPLIPPPHRPTAPAVPCAHPAGGALGPVHWPPVRTPFSQGSLRLPPSLPPSGLC